MKLGRRKREKLLSMIRKHDDPILHTRCTLADEAGRAERIETMKAILAATDNGVGIAAPQCGFNDRVIVVYRIYKPWSKIPYAMINPTFILGSKTQIQGREGCLSYPGVLASVDRWMTIIARWTNEDGDILSTKVRGFPARVIQHEVDHLDGICRVGDEWRRQQLEEAK